MPDTIKAGVYFPPCPNTSNRKIIKAWEKERAEFDSYIERINSAMAACDAVTDSLIEDLFSDAELAMLNLKGSFNYHVNRLMPKYALPESAKQLILDLMSGSKHFKLKDVHRLIMDMKHESIVIKEVKELDKILSPLPQWKMEDGANGEINKWWVKRNYSADRKTATITKIMRSLESGTGKFCRLSADFNAVTGEQITKESFVTSASLLGLL